jgi:hypothetical protein
MTAGPYGLQADFEPAGSTQPSAEQGARRWQLGRWVAQDPTKAPPRGRAVVPGPAMATLTVEGWRDGDNDLLGILPRGETEFAYAHLFLLDFLVEHILTRSPLSSSS